MSKFIPYYNQRYEDYFVWNLNNVLSPNPLVTILLYYKLLGLLLWLLFVWSCLWLVLLHCNKRCLTHTAYENKSRRGSDGLIPPSASKRIRYIHIIVHAFWSMRRQSIASQSPCCRSAWGSPMEDELCGSGPSIEQQKPIGSGGFEWRMTLDIVWHRCTLPRTEDFIRRFQTEHSLSDVPNAEDVDRSGTQS